MKINPFKTSFALATILILGACSVAKLEARLEANPQCKDVINPKTGTLMPCPGSDKSFYREVGLAPAKPAPAPVTTTPASPLPSNPSTPAAASSSKNVPTQVDCKPQIHKKTGGTMPCPAPD